MIRTRYSLLFTVFLIIFNFQCTNEYISDGRQICFENEVLPILNSSCTQSGCHNSDDHQAGYDFTNYQSVLKAVSPGSYSKSKLYKILTHPFTPMPPKPFERLTKEQITKISLWIEQGAENLVCTTGPCDTSEVFYSSTIKPIMDLYCNGCHAGPRPQGGIDFNTFNGIKSNIESGAFIGSITRETGFIAMPKNGNKLPECEILLLKKWVNDGAKNN